MPSCLTARLDGAICFLLKQTFVRIFERIRCRFGFLRLRRGRHRNDKEKSEQNVLQKEQRLNCSSKFGDRNSHKEGQNSQNGFLSLLCFFVADLFLAYYKLQ